MDIMIDERIEKVFMSEGLVFEYSHLLIDFS